jgi:glycosyltransferase involved in cell wall biosynthesis
MSASSPTVSIVLTCYNLGRYLDEAVASVEAQTYRDFELIIVDDGSTDPATVEAVARYRPPQALAIRIANRGLPGARNEGFRHSRGRYLCAFDADDRLAPEWLEKAVAFLDARPDIAFVSHWLRMFGDEEGDWTPDRSDLEALLERNTFNGAALMRREAFEAAGGFDESMTQGCEDWDFWLSVLESGMQGAIIPEVLFFYRRRADSMSREMMRGDTHVDLYERLVRKHERSYVQFLPALLAAKERALLDVRRGLHDRALEDDGWLLPELQRRREQAAWLRAKAARVAARAAERQAFHAELQGVQESLARETAARDVLATENAVLTARAAERDRAVADLERQADSRAREAEAAGREAEAAGRAAEAAGRAAEAAAGEAADRAREATRLHDEVLALRASASWRITRPLRAALDLLRRSRS